MTVSKLTGATIMMGFFLGNAIAGGAAEESTILSSYLIRSFSLSSRLSADVPPAATRVLVEAPLPLSPSRPGLTPPAPPARPFRPRPWLAAAEVAGINLGVWAVLLYTGDAYYSYISWETIRDNIRDGFEWDQSQYFVNFYHHPYHGYLYYTAGRANGLEARPAILAPGRAPALAQVPGVQFGAPHTPGVPPPPQVWGAAQDPH
jgi:hypothetical protein